MHKVERVTRRRVGGWVALELEKALEMVQNDEKVTLHAISSNIDSIALNDEGRTRQSQKTTPEKGQKGTALCRLAELTGTVAPFTGQRVL